jgi:hypothetical protein
MLDSFDKSMDIMRRSGRHTRQSDEEDFEKIVDRLMEQQSLARLPEGRVYNAQIKTTPGRSMFLVSYLWKMQGQLGAHACLGCLLYSVTVSVLHNVDSSICINLFL